MVRPEPEADERAALVAALGPVVDADPSRVESPWRRAALRESVGREPVKDDRRP